MLKALAAVVGFLVFSLIALLVWLKRHGRHTAVWTEPLPRVRAAEKSGDFATAEALLRQALAAAEQQSGDFAGMAPLALRPDLARVLYRKGDLARAAELNFDLLQAARNVGEGYDAFAVSEKYCDLAVIYAAQERHAQAAQLLRYAVAEKASAVGEQAPELAPELSELARALWRAGQGEAAAEVIEHAADVAGQHGGQWLLYRRQWNDAAGALRAEALAAEDPALWEDLADAEEARGDLAAARDALSQAALEWTRTVAPTHPRVLACRRRAAALQTHAA